jgi:hypothetical protein
MDMVQEFLFDVGWMFFACWAMTLAAFSVIAFGRDIRAHATPASSEKTTIGQRK